MLKLHLIPSGILYPDTICLIGSGTVVDPKVMLCELDMLIAPPACGSNPSCSPLLLHGLVEQAVVRHRHVRRGCQAKP